MKIFHKKEWRNRDGVSPVIATILMVAITVVLAAVLYVMVSGYMEGGATTPASGALTYVIGSSSPVIGNATFNLALGNPESPQLSEVSMKVLDPVGNIVGWANGSNPAGGNFNITWKHLTSDATHIKGGDRLVITHKAGIDIRKYEVLFSIASYSGSIQGTIPP
jgi:flagellin-like protein